MHTNDPFISIVIPTFNRAEFLKRNIPHLLKLDYMHYEIIVVDDGSTDDTESVMQKVEDPRVRYFKKNNGERAAARNFGADRAQGDYITFLDSDDILFPDALKKAAAALREKGYPRFMHMGYEIGPMDRVSKTINTIPDNEPLVLVKGNPLSCMGVFIERSIFTRHRFNEDRDLAASEDWEFWIRLAAHYGLRTDKRIVGRLIEHPQRSVLKTPEERLKKRKDLAVQYAFEDEAVRRVYGGYRHSIEAYWNTYIALHLAINGDSKGRALHYLRAAIKEDYKCLFTKRALVIFKQLFIG